MQRYFLFPSVLLLISWCAKSQMVVDVSPYYFKTPAALITVNPASAVDSGKVELGAVMGAFQGGFSGVRNFDGYTLVRIASGTKLMVEYSSNQQGEVFQRNRIYGGLIQRIPITSGVNAHFGLKLGVANFFFRATSGGVGGSARGLDGVVGVAVEGSTWLVGGAWHQFPGTELQPIDQIFHLRSYFEAHGSYRFQVAPKMFLEPRVRSRFIQDQLIYQAGGRWYYDVLYAGAGLGSDGYVFTGGFLGALPGFPHQKGRVGLLYFIPTNDTLRSVGYAKFEVAVGFWI